MTNIVEKLTRRRIITRCYNVSNKSYPKYGGRGIKVCERWLNSFENFLEDMGKRPKGKYSIDRINVNGNYEPSNCRWATDKEQARNTTRNRYIEYKGEIKCLSEWCEDYNVDYKMAHARLGRGWEFEKAILTKTNEQDIKVIRRKKLVLNRETGIYYETLLEASQSLGVSSATFRGWMSNRKHNNRTSFITV